MANFNVCSSSPLNANANHGENLKNENSNAVTVNEDTAHPDSWPFAYPDPPFTVPAKVGGQAGTQGVVLLSAPGTYYYATEGCPNDLRDDTNPKTVIIS